MRSASARSAIGPVVELAGLAAQPVALGGGLARVVLGLLAQLVGDLLGAHEQVGGGVGPLGHGRLVGERDAGGRVVAHL